MSEIQYRQDEHGLYYPVHMDDDGNPLVKSFELKPAEDSVISNLFADEPVVTKRGRKKEHNK